MNTAILCASLLAGLWIPGAANDKPASKDPKPIRVLMITGADVKAHPWRETTPALRDDLEMANTDDRNPGDKFAVYVSEEPLVLESAAALEAYDVILLNYYNFERASLTPKAKENLLAFVSGGKGLVCFHFSVRAFDDWPEYRNLVGRIWVPGKSGHGPRGKFKVRIKDTRHPITRGLTGFEADDELYAKLEGKAPIHVLVEADSAWSGKTEPLAWTLDYGKGRVFALMLGHDVAACRSVHFITLLQRGTQWVARREAR